MFFIPSWCRMLLLTLAVKVMNVVSALTHLTLEKLEASYHSPGQVHSVDDLLLHHVLDDVESLEGRKLFIIHSDRI